MKTATTKLLWTTRAFLAQKTKPTKKEVSPPQQVIVASVLVHEDRFLVVEKRVKGRLVVNQPTGRLEPGASPADGVVRETWEEAGVKFAPTHLIGVYVWRSLAENKQFLRLAYTGTVIDRGNGKPNDPEITRVTWQTHSQLKAQAEGHRSPFVLACVSDYLRGVRYPLDMVNYFHAC